MAHTTDHEIVSIYPFTDDEIDELMNSSIECVLMWGTKDGWPVGVTHAFVWHEGKIWLTFAAHRHRAAAIRRDNRVSVVVSSAGYAVADESKPKGAITFKGTGRFYEDDDTKEWMYKALSSKISPDSEEGAAAFYSLLDSPLRTILEVTPVKKIMYNGHTAEKHMAGTAKEEELGERLSGDLDRMNAERKRRGLNPR